MKKMLSALMASLMIAVSLTGCGTNSVISSAKTKDYTASLKDGVYYVRTNGTNACTPVYFGQATFEEGSIKSSADNTRVMWFKEDYESIPTLYKGDSLILYTASTFDEKMTFERFEDLGYTIGICGMTELKSGRYSISTDPDKKCTYPGGDSDEILKLTNKTVTLDTIGYQDIRATDVSNINTSYLSDYGTILGLDQSGTSSYPVTIYDGTIEHKYNFTANVRAFGSMEVSESYDYVFESEKLISITIPEDFNSGYYLINGAGLFRYVNDTSYSVSTNFNISNIKDVTYSTNNSSSATTATTAASRVYSTEATTAAKTPDSVTSKFTVKSPGLITVKVEFTDNGSTKTSPVTATLTTPSGTALNMQYNSSQGIVYRSLQAEKGDYVITYYGLDGRTPKVTVTTD
jgi:hypothetical protein